MDKRLREIAVKAYAGSGYCRAAVDSVAAAVLADPGLVRAAALQAADDALRRVQSEDRMRISAGLPPPAPRRFSKELQDAVERCCCPNWRHLKAGDRDAIPPHDCPGLVTAGAIWRFAGLLDPEQQRWERGQRRPYSQFLHTLCYKLGESFKRAGLGDDKMARTDEELAAMPEARRKAFLTKRDGLLRGDSYLYARLYRERKRLEVERNEAGLFAERAARLKEEAIKRGFNVYRKSDKAERSMGEIWDSGRLQDCGLDLRAARYAVKIFLSHWHTVGREILGLPVVKPWAIEHGGHVHYIPPPLWPMDG